MRILLLFLCIYSIGLKSQELAFIKKSYNWPSDTLAYLEIPDSLKNDGAVILNDDVQLNFHDKFIKRKQSVKILNEEGVKYYKTISLPQNFDITKINNPTYKQGRFNKRTIPFIGNYKVDYFAARIIRGATIIELPIKISTNKVCWVQYDGERIYDYEYVFDFANIKVNDIIEYTYRAEIWGAYDTRQFYPNDFFSKLKMNLSVKVEYPTDDIDDYLSQNPVASLKNINLVMNHNIDSTDYTKYFFYEKNIAYQKYSYTFKNIKAIKYPENTLAGKNLPHITANVYNLNVHQSYDLKLLVTTKYSWFVMPDTLNSKARVYNKYGANVRKFIAKFPENENDSSSTQFFNQVIDTIHSFKFITAEQIHYNQYDKNNQYTLSSSERLMKRELIEEFIDDVYSDILFEKNVFYYKANVQDRRLGVHSSLNRSHHTYELFFFALPLKKSYKFYIPRFKGIKYLPDELPFYYEGTSCALYPKNTENTTYTEDINSLKFIKTPISSYNENVRTENSIFKINLDSTIIHATIKTNLNGQFSTILRHHYNNDPIDSTIKKEYFKKCIDKPNATRQQVKLTSQAKSFPFKSTYNCSEDIEISKDSIDLSNWFSFILQKENFKERMTQNYYLDFTFTDTYNFLLEFNKPIEILNINEFNKKLSNDFFEINSIIKKQENNNYLLTVSAKAKQYLLPEEKSNYLTEYLDVLNQINTFKLKFTN